MGGGADCAPYSQAVKLIAGDFLPDLPDHGAPGLKKATNLYPSTHGYRPVGEFLAHTSALPGPCRGASAFVSPLGRVVLLAGTETALYKQDGTGWVEIADGYSLAEEERWRFVQFGSMAIVSNFGDAPLKVDLEDDTVAALGGSPPNMQAMAVVSNFVVGTQTNGSVSQVAWSAENDAEYWTAASRKSDYNDFPDGGEVTGIIGGEIGLILQRTAVRRMAYVGGNVLFRFDKISSNVGCASVHSVAQHGELAFWYSDNGFVMWDGSTIRPIGFDRVDESFNRDYGVVNFDTMSTAIDGQRSTVIWSMGRVMWVYNWLLDKWGLVEQEAEIITTRLTRAPSLEQQDPAVGVEDDNVEGDDLISFDAARFATGDPRFYVFAEGALGTFAGENKAATIAGRSMELAEGRDIRLQKVRPMTDATSGLSLRIETKQRLGDLPRQKDFTTLRTSGEMPVRARGRFVKTRLTIAAGEAWTYLQGVDLTGTGSGRR